MALNGLLRRSSSEDDYATLVRINLRPRAVPANTAAPATAAAAAAGATAPAQRIVAVQRPAAGALGFSSKDEHFGDMHSKASNPGLKALAAGGLNSASGSMEILEDSAMHAMNHIYDAVDLARNPPRGVVSAYKANGVTAVVAKARLGVGGKRSFRKAAAARIASQEAAGR